MAGRKSMADIHLVDASKPVVSDIYAEDRAKIAVIDWDAVHIRSDRSPPVDLPGRPRRLSAWADGDAAP